MLFSNKEMVRDLIAGFVDPEIAVELDLDPDSMVREHSDFVTDDLRERIDDIVWRVNFRGRALYLCILIEFQSTEDRWMASRLMTYLGLLYDDIVKRAMTVDGMLPPVLPIVLHTGRAPWKAPCSLDALLAPVSPALARYAPSLSYFLLDAASCTDEMIADPYNLASFLLRMERSRMPADLVEQISRLGTVLGKEESAHLRRAFTVFLTKVLLPRKTGKVDFPDLPDLLEVERMILEERPEWAENWFKEGEQRGILLGEKRGMQLGEQRNKRESALRMLHAGLSIDDISKFSGLSEDEVRKLAEETRN